MFHLLKVIEDESQHLFIEKYSGILSSFLIIVLFIVERLISARESRREARINWFTGVVVQPNLKIIHEFFINYQEEIKRIFGIKKTLLHFSNEQKTLINAREYNKLQVLIKEFEFEFLILLIRYDDELYGKLLYEIVGGMNDFVIRQLDKDIMKDEDLEIILNQVKSSKSSLFSELFETIRN